MYFPLSAVSSNATNSTTTNPIFQILFTSINATLQNTIAVAIGVALAHPKIGILHTPHNRKILSQITIKIFLPQFLIYYFGTSISWNLFLQAWIAPIIGLVMQISQILLGHLFFCWKRNNVKRNALILSSSYNNYGTLPYMFLYSIAQTGIFTDKHAMEHAFAFVTLYYVPVTLIFFSYGVYCVKSIKETKNVKQSNMKKDYEAISDGVKVDIEVIENNGTSSINMKENDILKKRENIPLLENEKKEANDLGKKKKMNHFWKKVGKEAFNFLLTLLSPPMISLCIGLLIGVIEPVKDFVFTNPPVIMNSISAVVTIFSQAYLPLSMIVTGGNIGAVLFDDRNLKDKMKRFKTFKEKVKYFIKNEIIKYNSFVTIFLSVFEKLIFLPAIVLLIVFLMSYFVLKNQSVIMYDKSIRPLMYLTILLESAVPVSLNLNLFATIYEKGVNEFAEIMLYQYVMSPFTIMVFVILFLYVVCAVEPLQCTL